MLSDCIVIKCMWGFFSESECQTVAVQRIFKTTRRLPASPRATASSAVTWTVWNTKTQPRTARFNAVLETKFNEYNKSQWIDEKNGQSVWFHSFAPEVGYVKDAPDQSDEMNVIWHSRVGYKRHIACIVTLELDSVHKLQGTEMVWWILRRGICTRAGL